MTDYLLTTADLEDPARAAHDAFVDIVASAVDGAVRVDTGLSFAGTVDLTGYAGPAVLHAVVAADITGWTLPTPSGRAYTLELNLTQPSGTPHVAAWGGLTAAYGVAPTLTATAGALDQVFLECDGVRWWVKAGALAGTVLP